MTPRRLSKYSLVVFILCLFLYLRNMVRLSAESWAIMDNKGINHFQTTPRTIDQQDWQPVDGSEYNFVVYSAYCLVDKHPPIVLIIGITQGGSRDRVRCQFHFSNPLYQPMAPEWDDLVKGKKETLKPGSTPSYAAFFVRCPLPPGRPEMVSVLLNYNMNLTNRVKIQYGNESRAVPYQYTFSVCVKPIFNFNNVLALLEWIEFYKLMGVEQFTFYNMTVGPEANCILNALMNGIDSSITVNVLPWRNHDLLDENRITDLGNVPQPSIAAAQNDCVYRHRGRRSKYMVFVDLDEFIMPREDRATNYREMMRLGRLKPRDEWFGAYIFVNAFFVPSRPDNPMLLKWCSELREDPLRYRICRESLMMKRVWREDLYKHGVRSKYIIKPEGVKQASNHKIIRFERGYKPFRVPSGIAVSRHYREFPEGNHTREHGISKEFGLKLVGKLSKSVNSFMDMCNIKLDTSSASSIPAFFLCRILLIFYLLV